MKYAIKAKNGEYEGAAIVVFGDSGHIEATDFHSFPLEKVKLLWFMLISKEAISHEGFIKLRELMNSNPRYESKIEEVRLETDFDSFWKNYGAPLHAKKKKAEAIWHRMSEAERTMAVLALPKYKLGKSKTTEALMHPETWLRNEIYKNYF